MKKNIKLILSQLFIGLLTMNLVYAQPQTENLLGKIEESTHDVANYILIGVVVVILIFVSILYFRKRY